MGMIFLGGTCNNSRWRQALIQRLTVEYFDPVVEEWNDEAKLKEIQARKDSDLILYVITPKMKGIYSIAEAVDDSNKRSFATIVCVLEEDDGAKFTKAQMNSLSAFKEMIVRNDAKVFNSLDEVAKYVNDYFAERETMEAPVYEAMNSTLEKFAEKRRGKEVKESFEELEASFVESITAMVKANMKLEFKRFPPFSKELFDKFTDHKITESRIEFSIKESNKQIGKFIYYTQYWKSKFAESIIDRDFVISTDFSLNLFCDNDFTKESCNLYFKSKKDAMQNISESIMYLMPMVEGNNTLNPSWIKKLGEGTIAITDLSLMEKSIELFDGESTVLLTARRDRDSSDFWHIDKS